MIRANPWGVFLMLAALAVPALCNDTVSTKDGKSRGDGVVTAENYREVSYEFELPGGGRKQQTSFFSLEITNLVYADAPEAFNAGRSKMNNKEWPEAAASFAAAVPTAPKPHLKAVALYNQGFCANRAGDFAQAAQALQQYRTEFPEGRHIFHAVGELLRAHAANGEAETMSGLVSEYQPILKRFSTDQATNPARKALVDALREGLERDEAQAYRAMKNYSKASELLNRQIAQAETRQDFKTAADVRFQIGDMYLADAKDYKRARAEYQKVADMFFSRNDGRFDTKSTLFLGRGDLAGRALLKIGDSFRAQAEESGQSEYLREAVEPYALASTFVKFTEEPERRAEVLYKLALTYQDIADKDHADAKKAKDVDSPMNPYTTWSKQSEYVAAELLQAFPESRWAEKWNTRGKESP